MHKLLRKPVTKNILSAIGVTVLGYVLLNIAFILNYLFVTLVSGVIRLVIPSSGPQFGTVYRGFPQLSESLFLVVVIILSWWVLKSKLRTIFKAAFLTLPLALGYLTIGILLYRWR